jgi:hypothetical protein
MQVPHGNEGAIRKVVHETLQRNPSAPVDEVLANWCRRRDGGPNSIEASRIVQIYDDEQRRLSNLAVLARHRWWHPW